MARGINSRSIKHPNTFSLSQGNTVLIPEIGAINQAIKLILTTARGELFGDPNFGSRLHEFTFDYITDALCQLIKDEITTTLNQQEPRIFVEEDDIVVTNDKQNVYITINYGIRYTDYKDSFKYIIPRNTQEDS